MFPYPRDTATFQDQARLPPFQRNVYLNTYIRKALTPTGTEVSVYYNRLVMSAQIKVTHAGLRFWTPPSYIESGPPRESQPTCAEK